MNFIGTKDQQQEVHRVGGAHFGTNSEIVALVDEERVMVRENRWGNHRVGQVKVSVQKTKGGKKMQPMQREVYC